MSDEIFSLAPDPFERESFAEAGIRGTYVEHPRCPECGAYRCDRVSPIVIEWLPGSDRIADFTWPALLSEIVVTQRVRDAFEERGFTGVSFGPVEMTQNPRLKKPKRPNKRTRPRVWLPYEGPPLWDLQVDTWCEMDYAKSMRRVLYECSTCGLQKFDTIPKGAPVVVKGGSWKGTDFFHVRGLTIFFVTARVKEEIEKRQFTNVVCEPRGFIDSEPS